MQEKGCSCRCSQPISMHVQTVREPLIVLDQDLRILRANRAFSRLVSLDPGEIQDQPLFSIARTTFAQPRLRTLLGSVVSNGQPIEAFDLDLTAVDGVEHHVQLSARRLAELDADAGRLTRVLVALSAEPTHGTRQ